MRNDITPVLTTSCARLVRLAAASLMLAACHESPVYPGVSDTSIAPAAEVAVFASELEFAVAVILPDLQDRSAANEISKDLLSLEARLRQRQGQAAAQSIVSARRRVARYGRTPAETMADGANLGVIDLTLDRAAALIGFREAD
jgi:hypothetical protein